MKPVPQGAHHLEAGHMDTQAHGDVMAQRDVQARDGGQDQHVMQAHIVSSVPSPSQLAFAADPDARIGQWESAASGEKASLEQGAKLIEDFTEILADLNKRLKKL